MLVTNLKLRVRNLNPYVSMLVSRDGDNDLCYTDDGQYTSELHVEAAIYLLAHSVMPQVIISEGKSGAWHIIKGGGFIKALVAYVRDDLVYPMEGRIESFRGKRFSELSRMAQREINQTSIPVTLGDEHVDLLCELSEISNQLS